MTENNDKTKRKIHLVAEILSSKSPLHKADFEFQNGTTRPTTDRDIKDLKEEGIYISSWAKKGLVLDRPLSKDQIIRLAETYLQISSNPENYSPATQLLCEKHNEETLSIITTIQAAIDKSVALKIEYIKNNSSKIKQYSVYPIRIYSAQKSWRLLGRVDGQLRQFMIEKISDVSQTEERFIKDKEEDINKIFQRSFASWLGEEVYKVELKIFRPLASKYKEVKLMPDQEIVESTDDAIHIKFSVNSLNEISSWCAGQGKLVKVIEPNELKESVVKLAKETLAQYKNS